MITTKNKRIKFGINIGLFTDFMPVFITVPFRELYFSIKRSKPLTQNFKHVFCLTIIKKYLVILYLFQSNSIFTLFEISINRLELILTIFGLSIIIRFQDIEQYAKNNMRKLRQSKKPQI